jgi:ribonuclease HII
MTTSLDFYETGQDLKLVCGVDEAGRGPLAGPVTAAAVILSPGFPVQLLADSKQLPAKKRWAIGLLVREQARAFAVGWAWPEEIDRENIHVATLLAMQRAVEAMALRPDLVLVDGKFCPVCGLPARAIIKGDALVPEIMAASIIAKTERDRWMERYARIEPVFDFQRHKGYPTVLHRRLIARHGFSAIHRFSFRALP